MIILAIKSYFFFGINSYNLGQKFHTCHFFLFFYGKMIKVVYTILVIVIKDLEMCLSNLSLQVGKSIICFEFLTEKEETSK